MSWRRVEPITPTPLRWHFRPQPDITVQELAEIVRWICHSIYTFTAQIENAAPEVKRHFVKE